MRQVRFDDLFVFPFLWDALCAPISDYYRTSGEGCAYSSCTRWAIPSA